MESSEEALCCPTRFIGLLRYICRELKISALISSFTLNILSILQNCKVLVGTTRVKYIKRVATGSGSVNSGVRQESLLRRPERRCRIAGRETFLLPAASSPVLPLTAIKASDLSEAPGSIPAPPHGSALKLSLLGVTDKD